MKKLFLILLALCTIFFLAGCDGGGGGGGSDDDDDDDSGTDTYKVTGLVDITGVTNFTANNGTITFTRGGFNYTNTVTLIINRDNKTYSLHEVETDDDPGTPDVGCTFSGTWTVSGTTIKIHNTLTKYDNGDPDDTSTWDDDTLTIIDDDTIHVWGWIMKD